MQLLKEKSYTIQDFNKNCYNIGGSLGAAMSHIYFSSKAEANTSDKIPQIIKDQLSRQMGLFLQKSFLIKQLFIKISSNNTKCYSHSQ